MNQFPLITVLTFTPVVGAALLLAFGGANQKLARVVALAFSLAAFGLAMGMWANFDSGSNQLQHVEKHQWIASPAVDYFVAVDGLGLLMVLLAAIVTPVAILASWRIENKANIYFAMVLLLQAGLFGTFTALNFFHWFIFWELSLIPAFFLIKLWGGPQRSAAATQFFIYTMVGSVAMLLSFLAIYQVTNTFDFIALAEAQKNGSGDLASRLNAGIPGWPLINREHFPLLIFAGVFLGLAVKVPLIPFHTWLPAAYSEAPTGTTMLLTGVMSKMGVYGFLRILLPIFPDQMRAVLTPLLWLAVATIVMSACAAFAQRDLKRVFDQYSQLGHPHKQPHP